MLWSTRQDEILCNKFFLAEACIPETTKIPSSDNLYFWPWTLADATAMVACQNGKGNATRACIRQKKKSPKWGPVDDKACKAVKAKRSEVLDELTNVSILGLIVNYGERNEHDTYEEISLCESSDHGFGFSTPSLV